MRIVYPESIVARGKQLRIGAVFSRRRADYTGVYSYRVIGPARRETSAAGIDGRLIQPIEEIEPDASAPIVDARLGSVPDAVSA